MPAQPNPRAAEILTGLDADQQSVVEHPVGPLAVIAGPGTGKTRAITHRIAYAVAQGAYRPQSVLALTFTTRAAGQMRTRLQQLGTDAVAVRTFHAAALRQAQYFWPQAYGESLPGITGRRLSLIAHGARRSGPGLEDSELKTVASEISWAKSNNLAPEQYLLERSHQMDENLAVAHRPGKSGLTPRRIRDIFVAYEEAKRIAGEIDFDDVLLCAVALLADHSEIAERIRSSYRHFIIDEGQDISPLQELLLDQWLGDSEDICVVGDPAQTVHSFAGASDSYLLNFGSRFPSASTISLTTNYRSVPDIVDLANRSRASALVLQSHRAAAPESAVDFAAFADETQLAEAVADWLHSQQRAGVHMRDQAVLYRVSAQSAAVEQALTARGIPYQVRGSERFFDRPIVRRALLQFDRGARSQPELTGDLLQSDVAQRLSSLGWQPEPAPGKSREDWESLQALQQAVTQLARESTQPLTFATLVAHLRQRAQDQVAPMADAVTLTTLHAAKGLEWRSVALVGLNEGLLPHAHALTEPQLAEERRLLYVGLTRGQDRVLLAWLDGRGKKPSRFLPELVTPPAIDQSRVSVSRHRLDQVVQQVADDNFATAIAGAPLSRPVLATSCRECGAPVQTPGERRLGRHLTCGPHSDSVPRAALSHWREMVSERESIPAFCVLTDAVMAEVARTEPLHSDELTQVIGRVKFDKYGTEILGLLLRLQG